jgi:hypothetical protein
MFIASPESDTSNHYRAARRDRRSDIFGRSKNGERKHAFPAVSLIWCSTMYTNEYSSHTGINTDDTTVEVGRGLGVGVKRETCTRISLIRTMGMSGTGNRILTSNN